MKRLDVRTVWGSSFLKILIFKIRRETPLLCKVASLVRFLGFEVIRFYSFDLKDKDER